jgi:hypothetical protein
MSSTIRPGARSRQSSLLRKTGLRRCLILLLSAASLAFGQVHANPVVIDGDLRDSHGFSGGPRISRPHVEWNSPVRATAHELRGEWIARLDLPLDFIAEALGEAGTPGGATGAC